MARCPSPCATCVLPTPTGPVEDDRFTDRHPTQRREVADLGGGQFRAGGEVELLEGDLLFEVGPADAAGDRLGLAASDLVVTEHLQKLDMPEVPGAGLGEAGFQNLQHAG